MSRRSTTLAAAAAAALLLAACSSTEGSANPDAAPVEVDTETSAPATAEATEEATAAPADGPLEFGEATTYDDGLTVIVTDVERFTPDEFLVEGMEGDPVGVKYTVQVQNDTGATYDAAMLFSSMIAGEDGVPVETLCDFSQSPPITCGIDQSIPDGQNATTMFDGAVPENRLDRVSIEVSPGFTETADYAPQLWQGSVG